MDLHDRLTDVLEVARSHAREVDLDGRFPAEAVSALRQSGLLGLTLPEDVGGLGGGPRELVEVLTSLAGACGSSAMIYLMHVSAAMPVAAAPPLGLPKLLHQLADGSLLASLAFSEGASRSHFWAPVSRAHSDGQSVSIGRRRVGSPPRVRRMCTSSRRCPRRARRTRVRLTCSLSQLTLPVSTLPARGEGWVCEAMPRPR